MPVVLSSSANVDYQIGLVAGGHIKHIASYVPDDEGGSIAAVFTNIKYDGKKTNAGLSITADVRVLNGVLPKKFIRDRVSVHLCGKKTCKTKSAGFHAGEWAYLGEGEDSGEGGPLIGVLAAAKRAAEGQASNAPPGVKAPQTFDIGTPTLPAPSKDQDPRTPIVQWAEVHEVGSLAEPLIQNDIRSVEELSGLADVDIDAMFSTYPEIPMGVKARFRLLVKAMRARSATSVEEGSGWVMIDTGRELPASLIRGSGCGGPEVLLFKEQGVGAIKFGQVWARLQLKQPQGAVSGLAAIPQSGVGVSAAPVESDFRRGGPLEEMAQNARQLLSRLGGTATQDMEAGQEQGNAQPPVSLAPVQDRTGGGPRIPPAPPRPSLSVLAAPSRPAPVFEMDESAASRLRANAGERHRGVSVVLKVPKSRAASIYEEWSHSGKQRLKDVVESKAWKTIEAKRAAYDVARALDVMLDSGLDVTSEPAGEVLLRSLAAGWFADRHPKDADLAEHLRESSMSFFGMPRELLEDARDVRKLINKATSASADSA